MYIKKYFLIDIFRCSTEKNECMRCIPYFGYLQLKFKILTIPET